MVSKTVLACLAVLATVSTVQSTVALGGFGPCVQGVGFLNVGLDLGFKLDTHLGGCLGVSGGLINNVLATLQDLLVGVLSSAGKLVSGLLSGLFGGSVPARPTKVDDIPYPTSVDKYILVQVRIAEVYDKIFQKKFGSAWQSGVLVNVYLNIANLLSVQLGIGGSSLGKIPDIATTRKQCSLVLANIGVFNKDSNFKQIGSFLSVYLNLLGNNDKAITPQHFAKATGHLCKIQAGILQLGGYPSVTQYTKTYSQAYSALNLSATVSSVLDVDVNLGGSGGIPHNCGCLK